MCTIYLFKMGCQLQMAFLNLVFPSRPKMGLRLSGWETALSEMGLALLPHDFMDIKGIS